MISQVIISQATKRLVEQFTCQRIILIAFHAQQCAEKYLKAYLIKERYGFLRKPGSIVCVNTIYR